MENKKYLLAIVFVIAVAFFVWVDLASSITPSGAFNVSEIRSEKASPGDAGSHGAIAGNVTELNIFGYSSTQSWQGYFGNVSGTIQLAYGTSNENVFYNWSVVNPSGEVYASTNSSISWTNIQCFNFTATGDYSDESGAGGTNNLYGANVSIVESEFGLKLDDVDGVDETFSNQDHVEFYTANTAFGPDQCPSTNIFGETGVGTPGEFEQVLLYEPTTASLVFTSILHKDGMVGFDGNTYDFQMLVLEDGHAIDVDTTTYYFFVELE